MEAFDYIIVGAGSAGCVLANRLTRHKAISVLLLEAGGPDKSPLIHAPAGFPKLFRSRYDWAYETEEQPHLGNRRLYWPRGKVLGGSSSINAMLYIRGSRHDYNHWRELGNAGWGYEEVLPYFKKSEDNVRGRSDYHGAGGPLRVSDQRSPNPISQAWVDAGVQFGLAKNDDFNGRSQEGVGLFQVTQRNGKRCSAAAAFLRPAMKRPNLRIETGALAARILFEKGRAVGVAFRRGEALVEARANREVILSGGAVNSPQLLMLSGVGPADVLRKAGVSVVLDLPGVGANLQDHPCVPLLYRSKKPISITKAETLSMRLKYLFFRRGPVTSSIAEGCGFIRTETGLAAPDIQFHVCPAYFTRHGFEVWEGHGFSIAPTLVRPRSVGRITIASNDPAAPPRIEPNYLSAEEDMKALVAGLRTGRAIAAQKAFDPFRGEEALPGPASDSDADLEAHVRAYAETLYHPAGTCAMGVNADAVVDPRLRVRGLDGLRVVDASVMPTLVNGNTNAPTIMIAERAADLILGE